MAKNIVNLLLSKFTKFKEPKGFDIYYTFVLSCMSVLAYSGLSYRSIIKIMSECDIVSNLKEVFQKISILVEKWNYEFLNACRVVSKSTTGLVKEFLNRLVNALDLGIEPQDFFKIEYESTMAKLIDEHDRKIDRLRKFCDAYSALLSSTTFLFIIIALLSLFYGNISFLFLLLACIASLLPLSIVSYLISKNGFKFSSTITKFKPYNLQFFEKYYITSIIALPVVIIISFQQNFIHPLTFTLLLISGITFIIGFLGNKIIKLIEKVEEKLPIFVQAFTDSLQAIPNLERALKLLVHHDYGVLNKPIENMYVRSRLRISTDVIFKLFSIETYSEISRIVMEILRVCIKVGASFKELGRLLSTQLTNLIILKKKYSQVAGYLIGLVIPLHATQAAIIALILTLMNIFNTVLSLVSVPQTIVILPISAINIQILDFIATILISTSVVLSAYAIYSIKGTSTITFLYYLGLISGITGITFHLINIFAMNILGSLLSPLMEVGKSLAGT